MRPLYYRFRRRPGGRGDRGTTSRREPPAVSAPQFLLPGARADGHRVGADERFPSRCIEEAAPRLRRGETDTGRIADLTGVPAALVELMRDTTAAEPSPPPSLGDTPSRHLAACSRRGTSRRLLVTVTLLSASAIGCSVVTLATGRPLIGQLGAVAAVLALLEAWLGCGPAGRQRRG